MILNIFNGSSIFAVNIKIPLFSDPHDHNDYSKIIPISILVQAKNNKPEPLQGPPVKHHQLPAVLCPLDPNETCSTLLHQDPRTGGAVAAQDKNQQVN